MLRSDNSAVEGLPIKLIITAIVLAITVPIIFASLRSYDRASVEQQLASEIDRFIGLVQLTYTAGPGNSALIEFDVPSGTFTRVERISFGDAPGGAMISVIEYEIRGASPVPVVVESPNVPMMCSGNITFEIASGSYDIVAECLVSQQDLNGDGIHPDAYISLSFA